jgi:branched-chain amino acid transport system permease protein
VTRVQLAADLWLLVAALGLNVAVGHAGAPVLGQGAFVAVGGYATALLADRVGWPQGVALLAGVAGAAVLGWLVGRGTARLRGAALAVATWALAWLSFSVLVAFPGVFGGEQGLVRPAPAELRSTFLGLEWRLTPGWHVVLALATSVAVVVATRGLRRGPVGLDLAAVRGAPDVATSLGVDVDRLRRWALAVAAGLGALAGGGIVLLQGVVAPADVSPLLSLQLYAAVLLAGTAGVVTPVLGVAALALLPDLADVLAEALALPPERSRGVLTALLLVAALLARTYLPRRATTRASTRTAAPRPAARGPATALQPTGPVGPDTPPLLVATGLRRSYGAVAALAGVDLEVRAGEVHALVGPNGSGKTTALRLLAGTERADAGRVVLAGVDLTRAREHVRVRRGLARTRQQTEPLAGVPARDQLRTAARATEPAGLLRALLRTPSWQRAAAAGDERVAAALDAAGLAGVADADPATLPYGDQRLVQVARAAATGARLLLLDEPAAGMSPAERDRLAVLVRTLAGTGVGVLLVEHDMRLVAALADRMTVLADGRVLATGAPAEVRTDAAVRAAYLGTPA